MRNHTTYTLQSAPGAATPDRFPFQNLDVYQAARQLAALVHRLDIRDAELRDQATRAAKSAFLNLCEGLPDDRSAMRRKYFAQADGSLHETSAAVEIAALCGDTAAATQRRSRGSPTGSWPCSPGSAGPEQPAEHRADAAREREDLVRAVLRHRADRGGEIDRSRGLVERAVRLQEVLAAPRTAIVGQPLAEIEERALHRPRRLIAQLGVADVEPVNERGAVGALAFRHPVAGAVTG